MHLDLAQLGQVLLCVHAGWVHGLLAQRAPNTGYGVGHLDQPNLPVKLVYVKGSIVYSLAHGYVI